MIRSTVYVDFDSDFILSEVTEEFETPLMITSETVQGDETLTFIGQVERARDEILSRLEASDAIERVGSIGEDMLLIRKSSCGATPLIKENNGLLYGLNSVYGTTRLFDIMTFNREDIRKIVDSLGQLGTVHLQRIVPVPNRPAGLSKRQLEVIEAAVEAGYYDWPRESDAQEISEELDITHPTFLEHLRKAEKKLIMASLPTQNTDIFDEVHSSQYLSQTDAAQYQPDSSSSLSPLKLI